MLLWLRICEVFGMPHPAVLVKLCRMEHRQSVASHRVIKTHLGRLICALLALLASGVVHAEIYRSVDANGVVSYSDQPSPGAQAINQPAAANGSVSSNGFAQQTRAQALARDRIEAELALAEQLAEDRRERSAERQARALVRAELRESRAREQALSAEQEALVDRDRYAHFGYYPDYAPYHPRRRRHDLSASPRKHGPYLDDYYHEPAPRQREPVLRSPLPKD